jgi:multiple antibiotic resistance protein
LPNLALLAIIAVEVAVAAWLVLIFADRVASVLGKTGISVAGRVMGFLLVAIAMELLAAGLVQVFRILAANPSLSVD